MNHYKKIISIIVLHITFSMHAITTTPYFSIRSQGANNARELIGETNQINIYNVGQLYGSGSMALEYTRSIKPNHITKRLFGSDLLGDYCNCAAIKISGSTVANRNANKDWLADYFGLPTDFQSTINFRPRIENVIADFNFYIGFDNWVRGLWLSVDIPLVYTKWNLNFHEDINNVGSAHLPVGYFSDTVSLGTEQPGGSAVYPNAYGVNRSQLLESFENFSAYKNVPNLGKTVTFKPLCFAQMGNLCEPKTKTAIADLHFSLGYNMLQSNIYHVGLGMRVVAPTGNKPRGISVFEPIVGNGNHWEFGFLFTSHATVWQSQDEYQKLDLYCNATVSHLFNTHQTRTFDLKNKPNSRYMLAQKMTTPTSSLFAYPTETLNAIPTAPAAQFGNEFTTVANLTTLDVNVSASIQTDLVFMGSYHRGNFSWDLGYNLWARSCEKIELDCNCPTALTKTNQWALKGDAYVYGFDAADAAPNRRAIALSATENSATIHQGTNLGNTTNNSIDNAQFAYSNDVGIASDSYILNRPDATAAENANGIAEHTKTSKDPILLTTESIDFDGARSKGLSHKIFTHISYNWNNIDGNWIPYLGIGAEGEFHAITNPCPDSCKCPAIITNNDCDSFCNRSGVSQWGAWIKGGVSFNLP